MGVMRNVYESLLLLIAGLTQNELTRHVRCLQVKNPILCSNLPKVVRMVKDLETCFLGVHASRDHRTPAIPWGFRSASHSQVLI